MRVLARATCAVNMFFRNILSFMDTHKKTEERILIYSVCFIMNEQSSAFTGRILDIKLAIRVEMNTLKKKTLLEELI